MSLLWAVLLGGLAMGLLLWLLWLDREEASAGSAAPERTAIDWQECDYRLPAGIKSRCAWFTVAEAKGDRPFRLPLLKLWREASSGGPLTVHLPGGPGAAGGTDEDSAWQWGVWWLAEAMPGRLLVFDPRGTGRAEPALHCPARPKQIAAIMSQPLGPVTEARRARQGLARCHAGLTASGIEPADFAAHYMVDDVQTLLASMAAHEVRLLGLSHGSRIALDLLRRFPERISAAVLDGVFPPEQDAFLALPDAQSAAIERFLADCGGHEPCHGDRMSSLFEALRQAVSEQPVLLQLPMGAVDSQPLWLTEARFLDLLFAAQVYEESRLALAPALATMAQGDYRPLARLLPQVVAPALDPARHEPVYWASLCAESRMPDPEAIARRAAAQDLAVSYPVAALEVHPCRHEWAKVGPAGFEEAVTVAQPVLLLAGERDPVTPPEWARDLHQRLPRSYLIERAGRGHGLVFEDRCVGERLAAFLADPDDPAFSADCPD